MKKKQNKKEEEEYEEEIIEDDYEDELIDDNDQEVIDSSLEIGGQIHSQSDVVKKFYQLPKDVKYSKFGRIDIANFTLKSRTYDLFQYVRKIQNMTKYELNIVKNQRREFYDIETLEELREYLKQSNKLYLWESLRQLDPVELSLYWGEMSKQIKQVKDSGFVDVMYGDKLNFDKSYIEHTANYKKENNLMDDFGLLSTMMTLTEVNKANGGWATKMMNTTISETKNEDLSNEVEETPENGENKMKSFFKR